MLGDAACIEVCDAASAAAEGIRWIWKAMLKKLRDWNKNMWQDFTQGKSLQVFAETRRNDRVHLKLVQFLNECIYVEHSGTQRLEKQRLSDQVHSHRVVREWVHWKQCSWIFKLQTEQTDDSRMIWNALKSLKRLFNKQCYITWDLHWDMHAHIYVRACVYSCVRTYIQYGNTDSQPARQAADRQDDIQSRPRNTCIFAQICMFAYIYMFLVYIYTYITYIYIYKYIYI